MRWKRVGFRCLCFLFGNKEVNVLRLGEIYFDYKRLLMTGPVWMQSGLTCFLSEEERAADVGKEKGGTRNLLWGSSAIYQSCDLG